MEVLIYSVPPFVLCNFKMSRLKFCEFLRSGIFFCFILVSSLSVPLYAFRSSAKDFRSKSVCPLATAFGRNQTKDNNQTKGNGGIEAPAFRRNQIKKGEDTACGYLRSFLFAFKQEVILRSY